MKLRKYILLLAIVATVAITSCKHYIGPDLLNGEEYVRLNYFGKDQCLSTSGGCRSWVLYIQDDHKSCQIFHSYNTKNEMRACAIDCDWNYNRESGLLKITLTETNNNVDYNVQNSLQGDFEWKDGEFGKRFYSKVNPNVSLYTN